MEDISTRLFRSIPIFACTTAYFIILETDSGAGELGKAKLSEKPMQILGGRLTVRMPEGAKIEDRTSNIMSAPEAEEHESHVVFDAGQERMVLIVRERFAFAGDDLEKDVRNWVTTWNGKYRVESIQPPNKRLRSVSVIPLNGLDHSRSDDATFVE